MNIFDTVKRTEELLGSSEILGAQTARMTALREKLQDENITVSVIGQFKRGKSTLINAFLGEELLPTGIVPITSAVTEIRNGERGAAVKFNNGVIKKTAFEDLENYVNEQVNPNNKLGVASVLINVPSEFLAGGVALVDTPGVGSIHKNNTVAAYDFVKESDAVIFMLSVDSPINEIEIDFLRSTKEFAGKFFFAVNKVDTIPEQELNSYLAYCKMLIKAMMETEDVTLWPISAKSGKGVEELKAVLTGELKAKTRDILEESARLKTIDVCGSALSQIELYWKVLLMPPVVLRGSLASMEATLTQLKSDAAEMIHQMEADRDIIIPGLDKTLKARLNEFKQSLSAAVTKTFEMDYHYEISQLTDDGENKTYELASKLGADYMAEVERLTGELSETLEKVLMYRNNDTFEVVDRVYKLNTLTRTLKRTKRELEDAKSSADEA